MQAINYSMLNAYALFNCYVIQCYQRSQNILVKYWVAKVSAFTLVRYLQKPYNFFLKIVFLTAAHN